MKKDQALKAIENLELNDKQYNTIKDIIVNLSTSSVEIPTWAEWHNINTVEKVENECNIAIEHSFEVLFKIAKLVRANDSLDTIKCARCLSIILNKAKGLKKIIEKNKKDDIRN